ncbi:MAG: TonB-dependent receptor [Acidobacteria bacterium]|nr:TonB-dependent receptor [Acidobacteriota bacterium]
MSVLWSQTTTGTILGAVKDETGAVIPGVTITVLNVNTGISRTGLTNETGNYRVANLPLGTYRVTAEVLGFKSLSRSGVELTVGRQAVIDFTLQLGEVTEEVTVTGEAQLISTTSSTLEELVDQKKIRDLPLNGRDFLQLTTLQPGVLITRSQRTEISPQTGTGLNISIGGGRPTQNNFRVDGVSVNDHANSSPGSTTGNNLGVEALREFSVMTNTYSAEYGRSAGGAINAVTRSGTNEFHGSAFYFHRNDNLDAANFFDNLAGTDQPEFRRNQFGAAVGGPIVKNRTFFFANYEGLRELLGFTATSTVLTPQARAGNLSSGAVTVNPVVRRYLDIYPLPNGPISGDTGLFFSAPDRDTTEDYFLVRGDHQFSDSVSLNASYTFNDAEIKKPNDLLLLDFLSPYRRQFFTAEVTQILSPQVVNSSRFGYNRSRTATGESEALDSRLEDPALGFLRGKPAGLINISGIAGFPGGPGSSDTEFYDFESFQGYDNVSYNVGRHSLKFGLNLEYIRDDMRSTNAENGRWEFGSIRNFLTNIPRRFRSQIPPSDTNRFITQWNGGFYFQDDIRWTQNASVNLGLRYEFTTAPQERDGEMSTFKSLTDAEPTIGLFYENPPPVNFGPRLGFAWDPFGAGKTVIRGGYGIFYDLLLPYYLTDPGLRNPPFFQRAATPTRGAFAVRPGDFPGNGFSRLLASLEVAGGGFSRDYIEFDPSTGYRMQYNLNIQHELFSNTVATVGYVGGRGVHLSRIGGDENVAEGIVRADGRLFFPRGGNRVSPFYGRSRVWHFDANSFYNAFQLGVNRRFSENLRIQGSYTVSKSVDDFSSTFTTNQYRNTVGSPYPARRDINRGLSDFDLRQNFVINGTWDIPYRVQGPLGKLVNGWQVGGIFIAHSGTAFTVGIDEDRARTQSSDPSQRPDLVPGKSNNPRTGNREQWFDPSAFAFPEEGVLGNLGRNTVIGPGLASVDFSLVKNTYIPSISEDFNIQFRFELFNALNRANFDFPGRTTVFDEDGKLIEDAGLIDRTVTKNREIQVGLKLIW